MRKIILLYYFSVALSCVGSAQTDSITVRIIGKLDTLTAQQDMQILKNFAQIKFNLRKIEIEAESYPILDSVAVLMMRYPESHLVFRVNRFYISANILTTVVESERRSCELTRRVIMYVKNKYVLEKRFITSSNFYYRVSNTRPSKQSILLRFYTE